MSGKVQLGRMFTAPPSRLVSGSLIRASSDAVLLEAIVMGLSLNVSMQQKPGTKYQRLAFIHGMAYIRPLSPVLQ